MSAVASELISAVISAQLGSALYYAVSIMSVAIYQRVTMEPES